MYTSKRAIALVAVVLAATLAVPVVAQAATIYVNSGVSGAKLGMGAVTAAKKLGTVKKVYKDPNYDGTIWVRCFGTKSHGHYALELYSKGRTGKVTAFVIYASKYKTTKGIHTGSSVGALKSAYGSKLKKGSGYYGLRAASGKTWFWIRNGKISKIWIWR